MRTRHDLLSAFLLLATVSPELLAKALGPPVEDLLGASERVRIVVANAREKTGPDKIRFDVSERLSGEAPDEVVIRTDERTFADVTVGTSYVVAFSYLRKDRMFRKGWEEDPEGPSTVSTMGLGTTALFEATPELKYLFSAGADSNPDGAARLVDALLDVVAQEDTRGRGLAVEELSLRGDLTGQMEAAQAEKLKSVLQDVELGPRHHDLFLQAALRVSPELTTPWLFEELRRIIIWHGTQYDLGTFVPTLMRTAALGLKEAGDPSDIGLLSLLLYANHPGVSKAALASMAHLDRAAAAAKADQALDRGWILDETRGALTRFLDESGP